MDNLEFEARNHQPSEATTEDITLLNRSKKKQSIVTFAASGRGVRVRGGV